MGSAKPTLTRLRQTLAGLDPSLGPVLPDEGRAVGFETGIDAVLGGGLSCAALHELAPAGPVHLTAATGFAMALPEGYEAQIRPRSGLAARHGVTVLNSPGTVDADYRGEVKMLLINHGREPVSLRRGERVAQMVVAPVSAVELVEVDELDATERGAGGHGSTGR